MFHSEFISQRCQLAVRWSDIPKDKSYEHEEGILPPDLQIEQVQYILNAGVRPVQLCNGGSLFGILDASPEELDVYRRQGNGEEHFDQEG